MPDNTVARSSRTTTVLAVLVVLLTGASIAGGAASLYLYQQQQRLSDDLATERQMQQEVQTEYSDYATIRQLRSEAQTLREEIASSVALMERQRPSWGASARQIVGTAVEEDQWPVVRAQTEDALRQEVEALQQSRGRLDHATASLRAAGGSAPMTRPGCENPVVGCPDSYSPPDD